MKPIVYPVNTSLSAFDLFTRLAHLPNPIFLDSADAPSNLGHYSFIAADPFLKIWSKNGQVLVNQHQEVGNPFDILHKYWHQYPLTPHPDLPPFQGGVAGFFSYELAHTLEKLPRPQVDNLNMADMALGFYDCVLAINHKTTPNTVWLLASGYPETTLDKQQKRARFRIEQFLRLLNSPTPRLQTNQGIANPQSSFSYSSYLQAIKRVKHYIRQGDIYQANIAQQFQTPFQGDALALYKTLRYRNPAAFAAYLNFDETIVASVSPERFLSCQNGFVETRPIKGTRPRGQTAIEDANLARELVASTKDQAENVMIVDLLRNDLSRVCQNHSVKVPELFALEGYPSVWHLVSTVLGQLEPDKTPIDLLKATFPGGSITGAPKIRAMEIITEIEQRHRGVYCGCIGYLGFDGSLDTSIVIRTMIIKDGLLTFHGGGGIVADSNPADEYEETLVKVKSLFETLQDAK